jgi:hypothetical protein
MLRELQPGSGRRGSVLLEVVLALALFVAAASVITSGINASIQSTERLRLQNHAANLAISVLSEMQMHVRPIAAIGPEPFPVPLEEWNFQIEVAQDMNPGEGDALRPVEVIIRNSRENVVRRLTQLFRASAIASSATNAAATPFLESAFYQ